MAEEEPATKEPAKKGKKGKEPKEKGASNTKPALIIAVAILLGFKMFGGGGGGGAAAGAAGPVTTAAPTDCKAADAKKAPKVEATIDLGDTTINLADGHFLKLSIGLTVVAGEDPAIWKNNNKGAEAKDLIISTLGGRSMAEFATQDEIDKAKAQLTDKIRPMYDCKVVSVLFTDFVMQ